MEIFTSHLKHPYILQALVSQQVGKYFARFRDELQKTALQFQIKDVTVSKPENWPWTPCAAKKQYAEMWQVVLR
jgi:hypothetical protein